jgi:hypothetical protein
MNEANPFTDEFNEIKQQGDDQKEQEQEGVNDYDGWRSIMARRIMRKQALWDMPANQGGGAGGTGPIGVMAPNPVMSGTDPNDPGKFQLAPPKRWQQTTTDKGYNQKKYTRENNSELGTEENSTPNETVYNYGEEYEK